MIGVIIKNEFFKLSKQKKPLVFLILTIFFTFFISFGVSKSGKVPESNEVFKMLVMGLNQMVVIFAIILSAETFTEDCKNGTIKMSVVQPVSRTTVVLGKLVYLVISIFVMYVLVELIGYLAATAFIGAPTMAMVGEVLKSVGLSCLVIISFTTIITLFSVIFNSPSLVTSLGIAFFFLSITVVAMVLPMIKWLPENTQYFLVTTYFTTFFNVLPDVSNIKVYATIAIALPIVLCVFGAIKVFQRKEIHF